MSIQIKRIYDPAEKSDGVRLLVDRLWPRGVSKERAKLDGWEKDLAPSTDLRKWFGHKAERLDEFSRLYRAELDKSPVAQEAAHKVKQLSKDHTVTLLYGAKDPAVNHALVLKAYLDAME